MTFKDFLSEGKKSSAQSRDWQTRTVPKIGTEMKGLHAKLISKGYRHTHNEKNHDGGIRHYYHGPSPENKVLIMHRNNTKDLNSAENTYMHYSMDAAAPRYTGSLKDLDAHLDKH
jgi:hypothetical protein